MLHGAPMTDHGAPACLPGPTQPPTLRPRQTDTTVGSLTTYRPTTISISSRMLLLCPSLRLRLTCARQPRGS